MQILCQRTRTSDAAGTNADAPKSGNRRTLIARIGNQRTITVKKGNIEWAIKVPVTAASSALTIESIRISHPTPPPLRYDRAVFLYG
ncbi:hypothetical protein [Candidatus Sodalis sp. SoCistrobi]|uniref:hypothetical protein n=1 Tax=Candidatus Sodalis sp. SoCistrobi TaxID=1922216 RepID=UPI000F7A5AE7|nr:hypothetical protein [Candidatus Sodalis sp. SoCistrobi]